jgi:DNA-binding CsgD family transcriptional regulator
MDTTTSLTLHGPMQLIVVGFEPSVDFIAALVEEIDLLQGRDVVRLLDVLALMMNEDGSLDRVEIADEDFGDLLIGESQLDPEDVFAMFEGRGVNVLQSDRVQVLMQSLVPGSGLALILLEHRWATPLFDTIADLGGVVFSEGYVGQRTEELVSVQLDALEETARVIDTAFAAQNEAAAATAAAGAVIEAARTEALIATIESDVTIGTAHHRAAEAELAASVTAVELQVLHYLPTKLTFALVADKLGISRSAAKQRAERLYQKLGVHTRDDAVARARDLGLIRHTG